VSRRKPISNERLGFLPMAIYRIAFLGGNFFLEYWKARMLANKKGMGYS